MKIHNMTYKYISILAMLILVPSVFAQILDMPIIVVQQSAKEANDRLNVSLDVLLDANLRINSNDMVVMTPILKSNNSYDSLVLAPMVVIGNKRSLMVTRNERYNNVSDMPQNVYSIIKRINKREQLLSYTNSVDYKPWMRDAQLVLQNTISGCASCETDAGITIVSNRVLPNIEYTPSFKLEFIVPEVEVVKVRSDRYSASFNFKVGGHELLRSFGSNSIELDAVDKIVKDLKSNSDLNITEFAIDGYASPEGEYNRNRILAQDRANSFANYLVSEYNFDKNQFNVSSHGEDWDGLRKAIESSFINDKEAILNIIDNEKNPDARDGSLKKLSNGNTYNTLLKNYYPPLRRSDYTIAYVARAFDVEEAKVIITTNPKLLSLNEMFLVAETYPVGSPQFNEVFDIAVRMFPNSEISVENAAIAEIEAGHYDSAIRLIEKSAHRSKMLNSLGVAHAKHGNLDTALKVFEEAITTSNNDDAKHNKKELEKHIKGLKK